MVQRFLICEHCKNIVAVVQDKGGTITCCGEQMKELVPCSTDAATEKHVPVVEERDGKVFVSVGSVEHPMQEEHYIQWISIQTNKGNQRKELKPGEPAKACFSLCEGEKLEAAYEYCNLHGLWKK